MKHSTVHILYELDDFEAVVSVIPQRVAMLQILALDYDQQTLASALFVVA